LWSELDERVAALAASLAAAPTSAEPLHAVSEAILASFDHLVPDALALALVHADAMGLTPELTHEMAVRHAHMAEPVAAYLRRCGMEPLPADVSAAVLAGAVLAAVRAWARAGAGREPLEQTLREALRISCSPGGGMLRLAPREAS
jgi:hypothetical protein